MLRLILVRPGATDYDRQHRIQGTLDVPLSDEGREQARAIAPTVAELHPTELFSAPGMASTQTSEILAGELGLKPRVLEKLTNVDQGLWQGLCIEEVKKKQPKVFRQFQEHPETVCPPEGESIPHAKQRVTELLTKLQKKYKQASTVLLVAPDPLASIVANILTGRELNHLWNTEQTDCGWEVLEIATPQKVEAR